MNQPFNLTGKIAVITGAGSGIGEAIAKVLARQGAFVWILEFDQKSGERVQAEIHQAGGQAQFVFCDVAKIDAVKNALDAVGTRIDILVNNAGIAHVGNAVSTSPEDFDRVFQVNVKGVYNCLHLGIDKMKENGGSILNLASIASVVGISERFAYSMSKGAVYTMTLSVAKDYIKHNIRCNCIGPGRVHTPFVDGFISKNYPGQEAEMFEKLSKTQPLGRMGQPEEIANLVLYLVSDEASFITGSFYPIDGGFITLNS